MSRTIEENKAYSKRLNRIEGQVRGINKMIETNRDCKEVLVQLSAINAAIKNLSSDIFEAHMKTCMLNDIKNERYESIDEVMDLYKRLLK